MKVAIGYRIQSGPWGGGNRFAVSIAELYLSADRFSCPLGT